MQVADEEKVSAIYTMVKDEIDTAANDWDDDFTKEIERRSKSSSDGTSRLYSWKETKATAISKSKLKKK